MAFCTQCGSSIGEQDQFCAGCGARQTLSSSSGPTYSSGTGPQRPRSSSDPFSSISPRTASLLCYIPILGWIPALFVLASDQYRTDREARFHAFQGLYISVAWLLVDWVVGPGLRAVSFSFYPLVGLLKLALFAAWIWMLIKVAQRETFKLPFLGDLAEKSVSEQR
jgi:uncharacterized membrane protein